MKHNQFNWNENEFRVYLLLYAAHADQKLCEEEKQLILALTGEAELKHISSIFDKHSDMEHIETIMSFKQQFFPDTPKTEALLKDISAMLQADERLCAGEKSFLYFLGKVLKEK